MRQTETITGTVSSVLFSNEGGFHVLSVACGGDSTTTVVGIGGEIRAGEHLVATGFYDTHPQFGQQFKAQTLVTEPPEDAAGILSYLIGGAVKGIGAVMAERIVEAFGERTRESLGDEKALCSVRGIGKTKAAEIAKSWRAQKHSREALIFLQRHGLGPNRARAVWEIHGPETVAAVKRNPYRALQGVRGVGFRISDQIAQSLGFDNAHQDRIYAGLGHVTDERASQGHTAAYKSDLVRAAGRLLALPHAVIAPRVDTLAAKNRLLTLDDSRVGRPALLSAEKVVAQHLALMAQSEREIPPMAALPRTHDGSALTEEQIEAVKTILSHQFAVLTGGPGAGKTTVTRIIADALATDGVRLGLCAPTGRASRRLQEATGRTAKTIHRLLEAGPGGFARDASNLLELDAVIVDEASMVDVLLMHALVSALPRSARLILVGDPDQLPAVGPGNVLRDVIASKVAPVARLSFIHRQASGSEIVVQSHRVNEGLLPEHGGEFVINEVGEREGEVAAQVLAAVDGLIAEGFDPASEIQVLTPMHKSDTGTAALNEMLRDALRLSRPDQRVTIRGRIWGEGDKVVQTVNDYDLEVMNGDLGVIKYVSSFDKSLLITFEGREVVVPEDKLANLQLAYALTGHKAQGSEFPAVVIPLTTAHYIMLERQWLYTAITRGKQRVVLVAEPRALERAVKHLSGRKRETTLKDCLQREAENLQVTEALQC